MSHLKQVFHLILFFSKLCSQYNNTLAFHRCDLNHNRIFRHLDGVNLQESTIQTTFSDQKQSSSDEEEGKNTLFPIKVVVVKGAEDVTIKIADRGGGVPRSEMDKIWTFAHSTLDKAQKHKVNQFSYVASHSQTSAVGHV